MNTEILKLKPLVVWQYFKEILEIPRTSKKEEPEKKEEKMIEYLFAFAKEHNLYVVQDKIGNVLIRKPAIAGMENRKSICLQSHMDMVGEKNADKVFDFENDSIEAIIEDGWVTANGTTLGADDGIGVAAQLAILESTTIVHGPIECLFTTREEIGLIGAFGIKAGFLQSTILLNLDSEDEGYIFISCAGGKDTNAEWKYIEVATPENMIPYEIKVSGLAGGHSGADIHLDRGNACEILMSALDGLDGIASIRLSHLDIGNSPTAIPREGTSTVLVPEGFDVEDFIESFYQNKKKYLKDKKDNEGFKMTVNKTKKPMFVFEQKFQDDLFLIFQECPNGVIRMSEKIENVVETSSNIGVIKADDGILKILTVQRSLITNDYISLAKGIASIFERYQAEVSNTMDFPSWDPNFDSEIVKLSSDLYEKRFEIRPKATAIHAGLECGIIGITYPDMDMISYGPTLKEVHSPNEELEIETVQKFWDFTLDILKNAPKQLPRHGCCCSR